jgi:hypothetical protein
MRAAVALIVTCLGASTALAQPKAKTAVETTCDVIEVSASTDKDPAIDGDIKHVQKKLSEGPWTWNVFKKLSRSSVKLEKSKPTALNLKIGSGMATLVEIVDTSKVRLAIKLDYNSKPVVNSTVTVEAGDYVVVGHPISGSKKDGHLLAVTCK